MLSPIRESPDFPAEKSFTALPFGAKFRGERFRVSTSPRIVGILADYCAVVFLQGLACSSGMGRVPCFLLRITFLRLRPASSREVAARCPLWDGASPGAILAPALAHTADPAVQRQRAAPVDDNPRLCAFRIWAHDHHSAAEAAETVAPLLSSLDTEFSSHVATRDALFHAGRSPPRPGSSAPAASAPLHDTGGSLPPVRLPHRHRPGWAVRRITGHLDGRVHGHGSKPVYQFSVGLPGGPLQVVRDFGLSNGFNWNPMQQGTYDIRVVVKSGFSARKSESTIATYTAQTVL